MRPFPRTLLLLAALTASPAMADSDAPASRPSTKSPPTASSSESAPVSGKTAAAMSPVCEVIGMAILTAGDDFAPLRGEQLSTGFGMTTWKSKAHVPGTTSTVIQVNSLKKSSEWVATIMKTDDAKLGEQGYNGIVEVVKQCPFGWGGPKTYPPEKNLSLSAWAWPKRNVFVEVRRIRLGKSHSVSVRVLPQSSTSGAEK